MSWYARQRYTRSRAAPHEPRRVVAGTRSRVSAPEGPHRRSPTGVGTAYSARRPVALRVPRPAGGGVVTDWFVLGSGPSSLDYLPDRVTWPACNLVATNLVADRLGLYGAGERHRPHPLPRRRPRPGRQVPTCCKCGARRGTRATRGNRPGGGTTSCYYPHPPTGFDFDPDQAQHGVSARLWGPRRCMARCTWRSSWAPAPCSWPAPTPAASTAGPDIGRAHVRRPGRRMTRDPRLARWDAHLVAAVKRWLNEPLPARPDRVREPVREPQPRGPHLAGGPVMTRVAFLTDDWVKDPKSGQYVTNGSGYYRCELPAHCVPGSFVGRPRFTPARRVRCR